MRGRREIEVTRFEGRELGRAPRVRGSFELSPPDTIQAALVRGGHLAPLESPAGDADWGWVPRSAWEARAPVEVSPELAACEHLELTFDGLETLASVRLGRRLLGRTENGLRPQRFDLTGLGAGEHALSVRFDPLFAELARRNARRSLPGWGVGSDKDDTAAWVRTAPVHMGWDFAPKVVPVGFTGAVRLVGFDRARVERVRVEQQHRRRRVLLRIEVELQRASRGPVELEALVGFGGEVVAAARGRTSGRRCELAIELADPELWWPNGSGAASLHTLSVFARSEGVLLDAWQGRIGLRRIELERRPDRDGESFAFRVNGRRIDARGANWVPPVAVPGLGCERRQTERLLADLAAAGATMVRVWGGGPPAADHFYDRCDELGLLVWQDFSFACSTYPTFDEQWMEEVEREATWHVRRLAHRASLALWCGNNEVENGLSGPEWTDARMAWSDYRRLFDRLLARVVKREDGATAYWPGSPHSPLGDRMDFNSESSGDAHLWGVWHGGEDFEWYTHSKHRFVSEYGFQSLPAPATLAAVLPASQRDLAAPAFERRQRAGRGNARLLDQLAREHRLPTSFADWAWATQLLQAEGVSLGIEHWRRNRPRSGGSLIWQWNEPWAAPTWSAIDSEGRPKALYHACARAWSPVAISVRVDPERGRVELWAVNDSAASVDVALRAAPVDLDGAAIGPSGEHGVRLAPGRAKRLGVVELGELTRAAGLTAGAGLLLVERVGHPDLPPLLARLSPWKGIELRDPGLALRVLERRGRQVRVELRTDRLAPFAWVEAGPAEAAAAPRTRPGDQFAHLAAGGRRELVLEDVDPGTSLRARSLFDLRAPSAP